VVGNSLEAIVGSSEVAIVGKFVGLSDGTFVGLLVAPNSVGRILAVGKSVGAFVGRNVGFDVVSVVGASVGNEIDRVGSGDSVGDFVGRKVGDDVMAAADGRELGAADGSKVGFKSDVGIPDGCVLPDGSRVGLRSDGSVLGKRTGGWEGTILAVGDADASNVGRWESVEF
jgi:hypothetical protein